MAQALPVIAIAATVAGATIGTTSQVKAAKQRAQLSELEATNIRQSADFQERQFRRDVRFALGRQRAITAAAGVDPGSGSPMLLAIDSAKQAEIEALNIRRTGQRGAAAKLFQARLERKAIPGIIAGGIFQGISQLTTPSILTQFAGGGGGDPLGVSRTRFAAAPSRIGGRGEFLVR